MGGTLLFFGTPAFAVPTLEALAGAGRTPRRVITQPARPVGRGHKLQEPPVAQWALERGIEVAQPRRVRAPSFLELAAGDEPDVAVVVAFGQIFPRKLLELPRLGCINLHASLLPSYRGAAPIHAALANGDPRTGVTTMQMEQGLDSGPILLQRETDIGPAETTPELSQRLAEIGAELMVETLDRLEAGDIEPRVQNHELATLAPKLSKEDGRVDWSRAASMIYNRLRAFTPWPGLSSTLRQEPVKVVQGAPLVDGAPAGGNPGEIVDIRDERVVVACGGGSLFGIEVLQRPGRRALPAIGFANGEHLTTGERFD
jgi:methionyl-tRNA formyltransferase